jgi:hypothetical protein
MGMDFVVESHEQRNEIAEIVRRVTVKNRLLTVPQTGASPGEVQPHVQAALKHLQRAREELQGVMHDTGGHHARALQLTENAIDEVKKRMGAEEHDGNDWHVSAKSGFSLPHNVH